ncbi:regulator of chromosome condensation domain-containing protein [Neospora caninum Liverpool]|uniref:Regulator of chromosome condensation domain-containing protein n=1 Tax=Neospora caninum (strain Liverpool) TaxID=572307 RepID=F0VEK9_NEOCL|nr:regulator of chromosome condensation domain-containing protein [Neospora caninum Liverpool]CBZ52153.1 regulator of chromosome condensation domain-containing protein [Neospora caninum Liverpool]|eukprot:XP_003882185.1 regulator of chromosome condensation domain-containing protein [Neospora caninum Liverpool]
MANPQASSVCELPPESLKRAPELPSSSKDSYATSQATGDCASVNEGLVRPSSSSGTVAQEYAEEGEDGSGSCVYVWSTTSSARNEQTGDRSSEAAGIVLSQPNKFSSYLRILSVACGQSLAAFIAADGKLYCWDWDLSSGDLHASSPQLVEGANIEKMTIKQVSCGANHLACVNDSGRVFTYGSNESGQRGMAAEGPPSSRIADEVFFSCRAKQVACGPQYTLVVLDDGRVYGMGDGSHGVLGNVSNKIVRIPTKINFQDRRVAFVAAGISHALAITDLGSTYAWGRNDSGQLGLGHTDDRWTPQVVCELSGHKTIMVAAHTASVALTKERKLFAWGTNSLLSPAMIFSQPFQDVDLGDALFCLAEDGGEQSLLVTPLCQLRSGSSTSGCMRISLSGIMQLSAAPGVLLAVGPPSDGPDEPAEYVHAEESCGASWPAATAETQAGGGDALFPATATRHAHPEAPLKSALRRYSEGCLTSASRSSSVGSEKSRKRVTFADTVTLFCLEPRPELQAPDDASSPSADAAPGDPKAVKNTKRVSATVPARQGQSRSKADPSRPRSRSASPGGRSREKGASSNATPPSRPQMQPCLRAGNSASATAASGSAGGSSGRAPAAESGASCVDSKAKATRKQSAVASQMGKQSPATERGGNGDAPRAAAQAKRQLRRSGDSAADPAPATAKAPDTNLGDGDSGLKETAVRVTTEQPGKHGAASRPEKPVSVATDDELAGALAADVCPGPSGGSTPEFGCVNNVYFGGSPSSSNTPLPVHGAFPCGQELVSGHLATPGSAVAGDSLQMAGPGPTAGARPGNFKEEFSKQTAALSPHENASAIAQTLERSHASMACPNDLALAQAAAPQQMEFFPLFREGMDGPVHSHAQRAGPRVGSGTAGSAVVGMPLQERSSDQASLGCLSHPAPLTAVGTHLRMFPPASDMSDPMAAPHGQVCAFPSSVGMVGRLSASNVGWGPSPAAPFPAARNCFGPPDMLRQQQPQNFFADSELARLYDVSDIVKKQKEFREIRSVLCAAQEDIAEVEKEKEELRRELRETKTALKESLAKLEESAEANSVMERALAAQKKRIQTLQEELDEEAQQSHNDLTQVLQKLSQAEQDRAKLARSLAAAQDSLQTFQKHKPLQERLEREASALRQQLKTQKDEQAHQLKQAEEAIGEWREAHAKLQEALMEAEQNRKSEVDERQAEVDRLQKQLQQLEEELQHVKDQVDMASQSTIETERQRRVAAEERVDELEAALNELAADFAASKRANTRQKRELDSVTEEKLRALQENEELREELQRARDEIGKEEVRVSSLQSEIQELRVAASGAELAKNRQLEVTEHLEQKVAELTGELSSCKEEIAKKEEQLQKYAQMSSQIEALQSDLTAHQNAARDQQSVLHELQMELTVYKQRQASELQAITEQKTYLEKKVHDLEEAKEEVEESVASLQEELSCLKKEDEAQKIRERLVTAQVDQLFQVLRHHVDLEASVSDSEKSSAKDSPAADGISEHPVVAVSRAISIWTFEDVHSICEKWNLALLVDAELHKLRDRLFDLTRRETELKGQLAEAADHQQKELQARQKLEELEEKLRRTQEDAERNEKKMQEAQQAGSWSTARFLEQQKYFEMELGITKRQLTECRSEVHQLRTRNSALLLDLTKQEERIANLIKQNERLAARRRQSRLQTDRSATSTSASSLELGPGGPAFPLEEICEGTSPRKPESASPRRGSKSRANRVDMVAT